MTVFTVAQCSGQVYMARQMAAYHVSTEPMYSLVLIIIVTYSICP